jgi:ABC-type siderophore export system fused ATPase/permease subunit
LHKFAETQLMTQQQVRSTLRTHTLRPFSWWNTGRRICRRQRRSSNKSDAFHLSHSTYHCCMIYCSIGTCFWYIFLHERDTHCLVIFSYS